MRLLSSKEEENRTEIKAFVYEKWLKTTKAAQNKCDF